MRPVRKLKLPWANVYGEFSGSQKLSLTIRGQTKNSKMHEVTSQMDDWQLKKLLNIIKDHFAEKNARALASISSRKAPFDGSNAI